MQLSSAAGAMGQGAWFRLWRRSRLVHGARNVLLAAVHGLPCEGRLPDSLWSSGDSESHKKQQQMAPCRGSWLPSACPSWDLPWDQEAPVGTCCAMWG